MDSLTDGDLFSVDGATTWYFCAVVGFGTVSVYTTVQRDDDAPTVRIDADRDDPCLVIITYTTTAAAPTRCRSHHGRD